MGGVGEDGEWRQSSRAQIQAAGCGDHPRQERSFLVSSNLETIWSCARCVGEARRKASHSLCHDQRRSTADSHTPRCHIYGFHKGPTPGARPRGSIRVSNTCRRQPVKSTRPGVSPSLLAIALSQVTEVLPLLTTLNRKFASIVKQKRGVLCAAKHLTMQNSLDNKYASHGRPSVSQVTSQYGKWKKNGNVYLTDQPDQTAPANNVSCRS